VHKLPNLLKSRHGVYYLRTYHNGKERKRSLGTKDWRTARLLCLRFNLLAETMDYKKFDLILPGGIELRNINSDDDAERVQRLLRSGDLNAYLANVGELRDKALDMLSSSPPPAPVTAPARAPVARTKPFNEVAELYLAEKKLDNKAKTLDEKRSTYDGFQGLFGNPDINELGSEAAISFKNRLISDGLTALRINKKLSFLRDLFAYAITHKLYFGANPFTDLAVSSKAKLKAEVQSYEEFTDDELKLIFEGAQYKTFMNKPDYHWLPFLALFTGARIESLASLQVAQVCKDGDIWFLDIKKDKTASGKRKVPLHKRIVESGFLKYVQQVKDEGQTQLFPHLKPGKNGYSKNCSRRFGQYLDKLGIKDERKVFHSFRSTFINRMTYTGVHPGVLMGIVGHYEQGKVDFSTPHFENYQHAEKPLQVMKAAIDRLDYNLKFSAH